MAGEDIAPFTHSSTYTRPWDDFEDSWEQNQLAQSAFGITDLVAAMYEDGANQVESFEYSWREPATGDPIAYNHQGSFSFDPSNFAYAIFDGETVEDFEESWGASPYNDSAIGDISEGTFPNATFDTGAESAEDFEEEWGISPYNDSAIDDFASGTFSTAMFDSGANAYEGFEGTWTEAL